MPSSCGIRNSRGFGLPSEASAETEPISRWPKPSAPSMRMARAFLSKPAASPIGLASGMPASVVSNRGSRTVKARPAARRTRSELPTELGRAQRQVVRALGVEAEQQRPDGGLVDAHRRPSLGEVLLEPVVLELARRGEGRDLGEAGRGVELARLHEVVTGVEEQAGQA